MRIGHPPDSNSSGVLGPARRGTVGDDLCVRPNHAALDPHERPVHWPSPRAQSWCSDGSPAKAASRSPARSSRSATATPAGPSPCSSLAQSDQRIDRPPLPERASSGQLVSGKCGKAGVKGHAAVCGHLRPGRVSGAPMHAGYQRGHGYSLSVQGPLVNRGSGWMVTCSSLLAGWTGPSRGQRWSAHSAARTNDLDAGEGRRRISTARAGSRVSASGPPPSRLRVVRRWRGCAGAQPYLGPRAAGPAT
jgi:hypothetical protein